MKVLVCGGRRFQRKDVVFHALDVLDKQRGPFATIIHGGAQGADQLGGLWALMRDRAERIYQADWERHGKAAGPKRNLRMLLEGDPDLVIAFPGGKGTAHMKAIARKAGKEVIEP